MKAIEDYGYTLILDEVLEVIQQVANLTKDDARILFDQGWIEVDSKTGYVRWRQGKENPTLRFKDIRTYAQSRTLIWYRDTLFLWLFPIALLEAFKTAYVLTFQFEGSHLKHYLDLSQMAYSYHHVADGELVQGIQDMAAAKERFQSLLTVYDGALNDIGDADHALSKSWFDKRENKGLIKTLFSNARNILMNRYEARCGDSMWTCYKDMRKRHSIKGYDTAFCPCNARATNEYRQRVHLAYLINVYDHPYIVHWFADHEITIDQDAYALSQ